MLHAAHECLFFLRRPIMMMVMTVVVVVVVWMLMPPAARCLCASMCVWRARGWDDDARMHI